MLKAIFSERMTGVGDDKEVIYVGDLHGGPEQPWVYGQLGICAVSIWALSIGSGGSVS